MPKLQTLSRNGLQTLFDATRASVREVIGRMTIEDILARKKEIQTSAEDILRDRLADYFRHVDAGSAFEIKAILLQVAQAPAQVQGAFDDVVSAQQDSRRSVSAARGDAREVLEQANARAIEIAESSLAYKEATILEARGRAVRFEALLREYQRAPEVTRRRLYLETMEEVLPEVEKMIIEPGASTVMPLIPLPSGQASSGVNLPSVGAGAALRAGSPDASR